MHGHIIFKRKRFIFHVSRTCISIRYTSNIFQWARLAAGTALDTWQVRRDPLRWFSPLFTDFRRFQWFCHTLERVHVAKMFEFIFANFAWIRSISSSKSMKFRCIIRNVRWMWTKAHMKIITFCNVLRRRAEDIIYDRFRLHPIDFVAKINESLLN